MHPRATVTPSTHGLRHHSQTVVGRKQIAATENNAVSDVLLDLLQKLPSARAVIALVDCSAVHGNSRNSKGKRSIQDGKEVISALA